MLPIVILPRFLLLLIELLQALNSLLSTQRNPKSNSIQNYVFYSVSDQKAGVIYSLLSDSKCSQIPVDSTHRKMQHSKVYNSESKTASDFSSLVSNPKGTALSPLSSLPHGWRLPGDCAPLLSNHKHTVSCCQCASYSGSPFHQVVQCDEGTVSQNPQICRRWWGIFCTGTKNKKKIKTGICFSSCAPFLSLCSQLLTPTRSN